MQIPIDTKVKEIKDLPYTISFIIRKRLQIDNLMELPKDKTPTERQIWEDSQEDLEDWLDRVISGKTQSNVDILINEAEIE